MSEQAPIVCHHGPLTCYLQPREGCPDLQGFVETQLPAAVPVVWLDSARQHAITGRWSLLGYDPWLTLTARGDRMELRTSAATRVWRAHPLEALRTTWRRYSGGPTGQAHRRAIGLFGWLSYDLNRWIERLPEPQPGEPAYPEMAWFGMRVAILVDHLQQRSWLISVVDPHSAQPLAHQQAQEALERAAEGLTRCDAATGSSPGPSACARAGTIVGTSTQAAFEGMVARVLEHIQAGDIFQANVSQRFTASWSGDPRAVYRTLRRLNPSPFACFLSCDELAVVSCSPERLVRVQEGRVDTRPIAGTRPRGESSSEDAMNSLELLLSEKERAEHLMLVDLARNDVGRISATGSVAVNDLMGLEAYSHVMHIVSDISGVLRKGMDPVEVIRAVFPGGTITGCPKVRCMQILRELEPVARGLYTGSLGYLGFDGTMDLNIAIRTLVMQPRRLSFHVGAGIVADSSPEREYQETLAKGAALVAALEQVTEDAEAVHDPLR